MIEPQRDRIVAAIDRELALLPFPPELRAQAVRGAVHNQADPGQPRQPWALALVAAVIAVAIVATLVIGTRVLRSVPAQTSPPPSPRAEASVAYDDASGQLVLFGGTVNGQSSGFVNETWTWNGHTWTHQHPATSPPVRTGAPMTYDPIHHVVVMFGGLGRTLAGKGGDVGLSDTWTWDGRTWTQQHTSSAPAQARISIDSQTIAFDPISRSVIYYTVSPAPNAGSHTWSWTGSDWVELHPATQPTTFQGSLVADGGRLLLIAQPVTPEGGRYFTGTWTWDGSNWVRLSPQFNLPSSGVFASAYDEADSRAVAFSGDTWTWDGSTWSRQHPTLAPSRLPYMVYFRSLGKVVAWGDQSSSQIGDLWAWDGSNWSRLQAGPPVPSPIAGPMGALQTGTPSDAETFIRKTVSTSYPILLPGSLPPGLEAGYSATVDGYTVGYSSDERDRLISLDTQGASPPPTMPQSSRRSLTFRGAAASYYVLDAASPLSSRWLVWTESGVTYILRSEGLTDLEFWQVANSLK